MKNSKEKIVVQKIYILVEQEFDKISCSRKNLLGQDFQHGFKDYPTVDGLVEFLFKTYVEPTINDDSNYFGLTFEKFAQEMTQKYNQSKLENLNEINNLLEKFSDFRTRHDYYNSTYTYLLEEVIIL